MILQKMTRKGFTLVELIVVITILAILATIAFLSFQGYSASARDSKRQADVRNLVSAVTTKQTEGVSFFNLITRDTTKELPNANLQLGGINVVGGTDYQAGTANFTALNLNNTNFKDPNGPDYIVAASTKNGWVFQIASTLEGDGSAKTGLVMGNFTARTAGLTLTGTGGSSNTITLPASAAGFFKKGDTVGLPAAIVAGGATPLITKVSGDGLTITVAATVISWGAGTIGLGTTAGVAEVAGLVKSASGTNVPVVTNTTTYPY